MKRNRRFFPVVLVILAGLVLAAVFSCNVGGGGGGGGTNVTIDPDIYTNTDEDGLEYELIVTGTKYELKIDGKLNGKTIKITSTGTISKNGDLWTCMPNGPDGSETADFDITIDSAGMAIVEIGGVVHPDGVATTPFTPGEMSPTKPPEWNWYTHDDGNTNEHLAKQSIYPPGGASRITNAQNITGDDGKPAQVPYEYPEDTKPMDKDGNPIPGRVFNIKGTTKVLKENRAATEGAQFPLVGWGARPDKALQKQLQKAYGYSFWVRLNSSTASNWAFLTQVETDFSLEMGYEYKHWFGNKPGDSGGSSQSASPRKGINNFTGDLKVGEWYKITVVMDQGSSFNMYQDKWIWQYDSGKDARGDFHQNKAQQIQWQIPLQHQVDADVSMRSGDPYDAIKGSYDFDLDFYGLELIMK